MPSASIEEKMRILSFVVVGGGPTGIEFSGEFHDFLTRDLAKFYPRLGTSLLWRNDASLID